MLGNVLEWIADCKGNYAEAPTDGSAFESSNCENRIARGGGWIDGPTWVGSGYRHPLSPNYVNYAVGFRVTRDLPRLLDFIRRRSSGRSVYFGSTKLHSLVVIQSK